jgi:hypothetical protein
MYLTVPCVELPLTSWLRSAFLAPHKSNGGSHAEGQTFARRRSHRSLRGRHGAAFQVLLNCLEENEAVRHDNFVIEWRRLIDQKWEQPHCPSKLARISLQPGRAGTARRH